MSRRGPIGLALVLGGMVLCSRAFADPGYVMTLSPQRGAAIANGTLLGAFSINDQYVEFQDNYYFGNFAGFATGLASVLSPASATSTTLSYPDGTSGLVQLPFALTLYLPSLNGNGVARYDFTGNASLSLNTVVGSGAVRFSGNLSTVDQQGVGVDNVEIGGAIGAHADAPDTVSLALAARIGVTPDNSSGLLVVVDRVAGTGAVGSLPTGGSGTAGGPITVDSVIADVGAPIHPVEVFVSNVAGSNTTILSADNTYTGGTTIDAGTTLQLGAGGTTGSILGDVSDSGTLVFDRSDAVLFPGIISGSGSLDQIGANTLTLSGSNTYAGGTTIGAGAALQLGTGGGAGSIPGDVTDNGTLIFDRSDTVLFPGAISGSGALTQMGPDTVVLSGPDTYTGGTTIDAGSALQVGVGGTTGSIVGDIADNGTLIFDRSGRVVFAGIVSGSGSLLQMGTGALTLSGPDSYTGGTSIGPGATLIVAPGGQIGSGAVANAGTLELSTPQTIAGNYAQLGTGALTLTLGPTDGGRLITGGSAQLGNGKLVVDLANGFVPQGFYPLVVAAKPGTSYAGVNVAVNPGGTDLVYKVIEIDPPTTESLVLAAQPVPTVYADTLMTQRNDFLGVSNSIAAWLQSARGGPANPAAHRVDAGGWTVWAVARGDFTHVSGAGDTPGYDSSGGGGVLALDRQVTATTRAGIALAVADEGVGGGNGASYQGQTGQLRLYGATRLGRAFLDGQLGGLVYGGTVTRETGSGVQAKGDVSGDGFGASLQVGARYSVAGWGLEPSVTLGEMAFGQGSVAERDAGSLDLSVGRGNLTSLYTLTAVEADHRFALGGGFALAAGAQVGWLHELADTGAGLTASLGGPEAGFASPPVGRDAATLAVQADLRTGGRFSLFAQEDTAVASRANSESVEGGVRYQW